MKNIFVLLCFFSFLSGWSQRNEVELRSILVEHANDTTFKDLKRVNTLIKESQKYSSSTISLAQYTLEIVKTRTNSRDPESNEIREISDYSGALIALLQHIDKWEKEKDTANLLIGYSNIANALYRLKIYEYASIYFKRRLNLGSIDSTSIEDVYKLADSHMKIANDFQMVNVVINLYSPKLGNFISQNDSLKYAFNKLQIEAYYALKKYDEAFSRAEQNIDYSKSLTIEKQIEAYIYLSRLKFEHKDSYNTHLKELRSKLGKDARSNRLITESIIKFYYVTKQYNTVFPLIESYIESYNNAAQSDYIEILFYKSRIEYLNGKYLKSFKDFSSLLGQYRSQIKDENLVEYELYASQAAEKIGKKNIALNHLKSHIKLKEKVDLKNEKRQKDIDEIMFWFRNAKNIVEYASRKQNFDMIGNQTQLIDKQSDSLKKSNEEVALAQKEVQLRKYGNRLAAALVIVAIIFIGFIYVSNKRNRNLVLNILPQEIANKLKSNRFRRKKESIIRDYDQATVLFTDFKGFTMIAEELTPDELVNELNECFGGFDEITSKYNLEKIKTIGDAYMAAGGIPVENKTNPVDAILAAMEIVDFINNFNQVRKANNQPLWNVRIGINTGHIVAGIIGTHKYSYDVWGDAVNLASRMESSGEPGKINISENTYELVKDKFNCTYRGEVEAKNKGKVKMYFVDGLKEN